ncbi:Uma2 family endonuclease [Actinacidiphila epipremni]|jgi:hypothetical protein|uniref:Uma2 family endonuclease n=1 Tax=Actinacidiphila epipremni TaxID=2053013 RepID=A0ABX0ZFL7_9ACTN|nr:Uma2 family endonuclease [Actinacidiphila epipremni]NJP42604.1 Uma2 family endonuclease [Actinacidiphila epipremni]
MSDEPAVPARMHEQITAEQYGSWSAEQCAGVEVVSPGSETTDRVVKLQQYARAGIPFYWRIEQSAGTVPLVYTYLLDAATCAYREGDVFAGVVKASAPFALDVDLTSLG